MGNSFDNTKRRVVAIWIIDNPVGYGVERGVNGGRAAVTGIAAPKTIPFIYIYVEVAGLVCRRAALVASRSRGR